MIHRDSDPATAPVDETPGDEARQRMIAELARVTELERAGRLR